MMGSPRYEYAMVVVPTGKSPVEDLAYWGLQGYRVVSDIAAQGETQFIMEREFHPYINTGPG